MRFTNRRALAPFLPLVAGAVMLTACSSSTATDKPSANAGSASTPSGVVEADQMVAGWTKNPTAIPVTEKLGTAIPKGKKVTFMNCGVPICQGLGDAAKKAGKVLGWDVTLVNAGPTPEAVNTAWKQVAANPPDAVIATGYPSVIFKDSLAKLKAAKVPVVECCVIDDAGLTSGVNAIVGNETVGTWGKQYAAWLVHATRGKANVLWVGDKDFPSIQGLYDSMKPELNRLCPTCKLDTIEVATSELGTTLPQKIAGYAQSHPDLNYVALGFDGMAVGLPAALTTANLSGRVKFIGQDTDLINKQYIKNGQQEASVGFAVNETMWQVVDTLARLFTNKPIKADATELPVLLYTKDNVGDPSKYEAFVSDYQAQFKALWGL